MQLHEWAYSIVLQHGPTLRGVQRVKVRCTPPLRELGTGTVCHAAWNGNHLDAAVELRDRLFAYSTSTRDRPRKWFVCFMYDTDQRKRSGRKEKAYGKRIPKLDPDRMEALRMPKEPQLPVSPELVSAMAVTRTVEALDGAEVERRHPAHGLSGAEAVVRVTQLQAGAQVHRDTVESLQGALDTAMGNNTRLVESVLGFHTAQQEVVRAAYARQGVLEDENSKLREELAETKARLASEQSGPERFLGELGELTEKAHAMVKDVISARAAERAAEGAKPKEDKGSTEDKSNTTQDNPEEGSNMTQDAAANVFKQYLEGDAINPSAMAAIARGAMTEAQQDKVILLGQALWDLRKEDPDVKAKLQAREAAS